MVLTRLRHLVDLQLSIAELIGTGLLLATPYLIMGVVWSSTHTEPLQQMGGVDLLVSLLGSIVLWPVLLLANACLM
jgi:NADH:ubiquinone oxidoreductase subunit 4 (subunit M)